MAYPIERTGVSSRIQDGVEDNVRAVVGEDYITLLVLPRGVDNQPWKELEAGLKIKFDVCLNELREVLNK